MQSETEEHHDTTVKTFHSAFSSPDADAILASKDSNGTVFRVHTATLKTASGWFRAMFSLPQNATPSLNDVIYVDEDSETLECLLRMVCCLPLPKIDSYDLVDSLLFAAEKYDMPGVLSIIRIIVATPALLDQPFRLYIIARRFGWDDEARSASTHTLSYNLYDKEIRGLLQRLSTNALLDLLELHRSRREGLRQRLDEPPFVAGGTVSCASCGALIDYHTWRELKYKIILEMDIRPLGDTVVEYGLVNWPEAHACWSAKCPSPTCDRFLYDKTETVRVIRECIEGLPRSV